MNNWKDINIEKPEDGQQVLVYNGNNKYSLVIWNEQDNYWTDVNVTYVIFPIDEWRLWCEIPKI